MAIFSLASLVFSNSTLASCALRRDISSSLALTRSCNSLRRALLLSIHVLHVLPVPPEPAGDRWDERDESASGEVLLLLLLLLLVHVVEDVADRSARPRGLAGLVVVLLVGLDVHVGFAVIVGRSESLEVIIST